MKKKIGTFIIFLLTPFCYISQTDSVQPKIKFPEQETIYRGYFTFGLGSATPKGLLADQNPKNDSAGLAKNGLDLRFSFGYLFHDNIGVCAASYFQFFRINSQALADYLTNLNPNYSYNVDITKSWRLRGTLLGVYGRLPIDNEKKIVLEPRLLLGLSTGQSPEFSVTSYLNGSGYTLSNTVKQSSGQSDPVVTYVFGGTLRIELGRFCLAANVDYTKLLKYTYYNNITITYSANGNGTNKPPDNITANQEMRSLAMSLSLGLRFGRRKLFE